MVLSDHLRHLMTSFLWSPSQKAGQMQDSLHVRTFNSLRGCSHENEDSPPEKYKTTPTGRGACHTPHSWWMGMELRGSIYLLNTAAPTSRGHFLGVTQGASWHTAVAKKLLEASKLQSLKTSLLGFWVLGKSTRLWRKSEGKLKFKTSYVSPGFRARMVVTAAISSLHTLGDS